MQGLSHRLMVDLNDAHDLYFITDRFDTKGLSATRQTVDWIAYYLVGRPPAGVIVAKKKGPVAAALGLDAFLDDKPENCLDVCDAVPNCRVYLCTLPHNLSYKQIDGNYLPRVADFNEFAKLILEAN